MELKEKLFADFRLYAVTDLKTDDPGVFERVEQAYKGGADIIQLRSKYLSDISFHQIGLKLRKIADQYGKLFFVNDRLDIALSVSADGLHIGQDDLPVAVIRRILKESGKKLWVGKSTHSPEQALAAADEAVDYIGVGPVYSTPTKSGYKPAGLETVRFAAKNIRKPFVAIGGIDVSNVNEVVQAGARRVAMVRAIFSGDNTYENTVKIRKKIESAASH